MCRKSDEYWKKQEMNDDDDHHHDAVICIRSLNRRAEADDLYLSLI